LSEISFPRRAAGDATLGATFFHFSGALALGFRDVPLASCTGSDVLLTGVVTLAVVAAVVALDVGAC
jgi:hypothetical protein